MVGFDVFDGLRGLMRISDSPVHSWCVTGTTRGLSGLIRSLRGLWLVVVESGGKKSGADGKPGSVLEAVIYLGP